MLNMEPALDPYDAGLSSSNTEDRNLGPISSRPHLDTRLVWH